MEVPKIDLSGPASICPPKCKDDLLHSKYRKILPLPPNNLKTRRNPEAYTKKNWDQHSVVVKKTTKRRKFKDKSVDNIDKRKEHNSLERKRRVKINELIDRLKELIPNIQGKRKASKVTILRESNNLVKELQTIENNFELRKRLGTMQSCTNL